MDHNAGFTFSPWDPWLLLHYRAHRICQLQDHRIQQQSGSVWPCFCDKRKVQDAKLQSDKGHGCLRKCNFDLIIMLMMWRSRRGDRWGCQVNVRLYDKRKCVNGNGECFWLDSFELSSGFIMRFIDARSLPLQQYCICSWS